MHNQPGLTLKQHTLHIMFLTTTASGITQHW